MDARFGGSVCIGDYVMESGDGWWKYKGRRYEKWLRLAKNRCLVYNGREQMFPYCLLTKEYRFV